MAVTAFMYGMATFSAANGTVPWPGSPPNWTADAAAGATGGTVMCALMIPSYSPDQNAHRTWADVSASEAAFTGYTAKGTPVGTRTVNYATKVLNLRAAASTFKTLTSGALGTAAYAVVYRYSGTDATSPLLSYVNFGGNQTFAGSDFTITWDTTDGIMKITTT